jgi:5-bromo-4-chloroindolyl phosphate hydrolysis protein
MATRIKYEDVKHDIESKGWTLVSDSYKNLKTDLELTCPNNH